MGWGSSSDGVGADGAAGGMLALSLFGGFQLAYQSRSIDLGSRKAQALLAYLVLSPNLWATREQAAGLLWSDVPEAQARASLRQVLRRLRTVFGNLGTDALQITRTEIRLDPNQLTVDVWDVVDSVESTAPQPLALQRKHLMESLLKGYEDLDGSLRSWLLVQRQNLHDRMVLSLASQLSEYGSQIPAAKLQTVKNLAIALANLDPTHEGACRSLMAIAAQESDIATALRRYNALWNLLDSEYDMEPSDETQSLVARIKSGDYGAASTPQVPVPQTGVQTPENALATATEQPRRPRLVIASFDVRAVGGADVPVEAVHLDLVNGIRHQLIASLVRFREWSVVDGPGEKVPEPEPGQAQYTVNASLVRSGDQIRLVLTLYDQSNNEFIWSEEHEADLEKWFMTQRLIVRRIAISLNVQISADRARRILWQPDGVKLSIYDRWLQATALATRWRKENRVASAEIFSDIVKEVPNFAPALFGLANYSNSYHLIFPGAYRQPDRAVRAQEQARLAVNLDPTNCRAHLCAAWSSALNGQFEQAELSYQMAYELNENDPWTLISSTLGLSFCGRQDIASERAAQAVDVGLTVLPLHWGYQGVIQFMCGDFEACVRAMSRSEDAIYNFAAWNASALGHMGQRNQARSEWARFVEMVRADWHSDRAHTEDAIAEWLLNAFPIRRIADWQSLRDGLAAAGVPVPDTMANKIQSASIKVSAA